MLYCAYGSNMNLKQMQLRCPNSKKVGTGILWNYQLIFKLHADVVLRDTKEGCYVPVVLFDIAPEDWGKLDIYEGYPSYYIKEVVKVEMDNGTVEECIVYVMADSNGEYIKPKRCIPSNSYYSSIVNGYYQNGLEKHIFVLKDALYNAFYMGGMEVV